MPAAPPAPRIFFWLTGARLAVVRRSYSITITLALVFVLAKALAYLGIIDSTN